MRIFLTGATGFVGRHLIPRLQADQHQVVALVRQDKAAAELSSIGVEVVRGDLRDILPWGEAMTGCDCLIHAAAKVATWGVWRDFEQHNIVATQKLLEAARYTGISRFIYISSESVMQGPLPLVDVDETSHTDQHVSYYGRSKYLAEQAVLAHQGNMQCIVLRPTFVWGRHCPAIDTITRKARRGMFIWVDDGRSPFEHLHVLNLVEAITLSLHKGRHRDIMLITDGERHTVRDFFVPLLATLGAPLPTRSFRGSTLAGFVNITERLWQTLHLPFSPPINRFELAFVSQPRRFKIQRAMDILGYEPVISFREGIGALRQ
ncbi:NAD(P)-dependent oxidoreductase [Chitinivorax sp. B]|uniref:NAD-dependent epimerase/dehydratase family protein n=1 Tax=Chitinivorax sp. B TaxID=2502235 RepID=UPI0010FA31E9|nr:NAD(P)-dependent oxidoreductase [Chitinivorax sp. B]